MKKIAIYDPPMCCSSGVCGPSIDPILPRVAGMLSQLDSLGVEVERYNLSQQPQAFAANLIVKKALEEAGTDALPLIFVDDQLIIQGHYPDTLERSELVNQARN